MKAITVWQPWASLLACGAKEYETRSWATKYRGSIAIHAALRDPMQDLYPVPFIRAVAQAFGDSFDAAMHNAPRGAIIATAELVGCWEMIRNPVDGVMHFLDETDAAVCINGNELLFGDWQPGRFAWEFKNMQMLDTPIPARGAQRLWNWKTDKWPAA